MKSLSQNVVDILQAPRTAAITGAATVGTGATTCFDLIPSDIGKLASLVGLVLSIILICIHIRKSRLDIKEGEIRIAILRHKQKALLQDFPLRREKDGDDDDTIDIAKS